MSFYLVERQMPWAPSTPGPAGFLSKIDPNIIRLLIYVFLSITMYNCIELIVLIFITFEKYEGLYFWSLLVTTALGVLPEAVFLILLYDVFISRIVAYVFAAIFWWVMVTGESIVLYSRLHILLKNKLVLRLVLIMIIVDAIIFHIPNTVLGLGVVAVGGRTWVGGFSIMERLEATAFTVQECIISGLYIYEALKSIRYPSERSRLITMYQLLAINLVIILLDAVLLVLIYLEWWILHATLKPLVYGIKLKLEFAVLSKLISVSRVRERHEVPEFVDENQIQGDITHAPDQSAPEQRESTTSSIDLGRWRTRSSLHNWGFAQRLAPHFRSKSPLESSTLSQGTSSEASSPKSVPSQPGPWGV